MVAVMVSFCTTHAQARTFGIQSALRARQARAGGRAMATDTLIADYNDLASAERPGRTHRGVVATVIVEPTAGNKKRR